MKTKILVIDDDKNICEVIRLYLEKESYEVQVAHDGNAGVAAFSQFSPDLVLLDLMLPGKDGFAVCRELREISPKPVIMITAKTDKFDTVLGLEMGADDYITKPFDAKELLARVKAVLRRYVGQTVQNDEVLRFENLEISKARYELRINGVPVEIPPKELVLLYFLASNYNHVFTRNQLLDKVWGFDYLGDSRTVDVHVKRLREKLNGVSERWSLKTVWGVGYKFEVIE